MMRLLSRLVLWISGWKIKGEFTEEMRRSVIIEAPHTSNWDFIIGRFGFYTLGAPVRFIIKKEWFFFPVGYLARALGGIPVDRSRRSKLVSHIANLYKTQEQLAIVITPEGTRKLVPEWKKGFYYIAMQAGVPIVLGYLDYKKKEGGLGPVFYPTGDYEKDLERIQSFYVDKQARHPENSVLTALTHKEAGIR